MQTHYLEHAILKHPFWAGLNPHFVHLLYRCATVEHYGSGQPIFQEHSQAEHFYLITKGQVLIHTFVPGKGYVPIQTLGPGDALGWSWLSPTHEWQFSARAVEPCELIVFGGAGLREAAEENRDFAYELTNRVAQVLLQRLQATRRSLIDFYEVPHEPTLVTT